jgi:acetyl esterase/lipase
VTGEVTPLVPMTARAWGTRLLHWCAGAAVSASLLISPRPAALLVRKVFATGGAQVADRLAKHAPADVVASVDERYGDDDAMLLDAFRPAAASGPQPLLVWVHGGGWIGGSKNELAAYFKLIASYGYAVVAPNYSLAPEHRYPAPPRQVMQALRYAQANAERLQLDPHRIVIAGDSAGAQIAAQVAALVTTPGYAAAVGVEPTIAAEQLRGAVLACGPYDLALTRHASTPLGRRFMKAVLWAYSGTRDYLDDPSFATMAVADHLTPAFPPALITVGNADPLRPHTELLVSRLRAQRLEPETVLFPDDHRPPLGHEYQFDLDTEAGQRFLQRLLAFLQRHLAA